MAPKDVAVRPRRSAFAAAFLSFLFPGLGHAYLGRWLRALAWAVIPVIAVAAIAGRVVSGGVGDLVEVLADPAVLDAMVAILVIDAIYRLLALLDAYRLATDRSVGSSATRAASAAGLVALVIVLVGSHVVVARPVFFATDLYADVSRNAGDDTEVIGAEELAGLGEDWQLLTEEQLEAPTEGPDGPAESPGADDATAPPTPEPTAEPTTTPAGAEWNGKERLNILLIGHDGGRQGRGDTSLLTDTMITVSVDPTTGRLAFISLPRDTSGVPLPRSWPAYSQLGGKYNNKINTLYYQARANPSLFPGNDKERGYMGLMGALGELYGLDIKYYVAVNLNSFRSVVNTLGGVIVDVQLPVMDDGYATADGRGKLKLYVPPGMTRMNGQDALAYARSRHGSSDYDRAARQQRVITSVREQSDIDSLLEPGVLADLINQLKKDVKTNIPPKLVPAMLSLAQKVDLDRRENLVLGSSSYVEECYPCGSSGLWMLKAKPASIKQAVQNVFSTTRAQARAINAVREEGAVVHVLNGQGGPNTKAVNIASNLGGKGISALVPPLGGGRAESDDVTNTVVTFYNGAEESMPETADRVKRTFKDKGRELRYLEDPEAAADIVITVGSKTEALKP
jgi:polyisoprenyl-teichoic acid--peptidoglycan teichoic acid transferase